VLYQLVPRGGGPGTWPLTGGTTTIVGRSPHANVWLHDDYTSEYHCLIALDPSDQGRLPHLIDLRSSNGTRVNGRPVRRCHISPGDVVTIGHADFEVHDAPRPRDGRLRANVKLFTPADEQIVMPQSILPALAERMAQQRAALMAGAGTSDSPRPRPQHRRGIAGLYPGSEGQPFGLTADPDCLFTGRQHREAIDTLIDWLGTRRPLAAIEGEPGTGKSLLLACLERHLSYLRPRPVLLRPSAARLSLDELTTSVVEAAAEQHTRIPTWGSSAKALWESAVTEFRKRKILVALLFDEADKIEAERLRALTGLVHSPAACTVTHLVLAGGASVSELANTPPLAEHLGACCHLAPLPLDEVAPYITHRLRAVTGRRERMFTRHALKLIAAYSRGVPRLINLVAGPALFAADRARVPQVTSDLVSRTIRDALGDEVPTVSD
jgi:type II secretory pathway predicted ATPase ExeA/pSer/pThr/pTyr-binding forkhead associated (FHA) protein